jgi:hypothetical protein
VAESFCFNHLPESGSRLTLTNDIRELHLAAKILAKLQKESPENVQVIPRASLTNVISSGIW